ncbi:MAG: type 1 glutamine amidotransferase [Granulosicoccus sp.]
MSLRAKRYLFVKHSPNWNVDRCTRWMQTNGKTVDWCYPVDEDPFPDPAAYAGVVVFGGANSANDCASHEWVRRELHFVEQCLEKDTAFFGICLGAQILARALGADVRPHESELKEVGFCRVDPVEPASPYLTSPLTVMQWHSEGFDLPPGTQRIATGDDFPNQAYALSDRVIGLQFHPEVNSDVLAIWHERNKTRSSGVLTDEQRAAMMADAHRYENDITIWLDGFLTRWTGLCEARR